MSDLLSDLVTKYQNILSFSHQKHSLDSKMFLGGAPFAEFIGGSQKLTTLGFFGGGGGYDNDVFH